MTPDKLARLLEAMRGRTVAVLGDVILDEYVWGEVDRISPDAPVQVVEIRRRSHVAGGAANVAHNLAVAGASVRLVGAVGDDAAGATLLERLAAAGLDASGIVRAAGRPTTVKTRVVARGQQIVRLDAEERAPIDAASARRLAQALEAALRGADALLVSDYAKGVVVEDAVSRAARLLPVGRPLVVDPKSVDLARYRGCTAITPNRKEAEAASGVAIRADGDIDAAAKRIRDACGAGTVLITLGERGMAVAGEGHAVVTIPSQAREVYDVTGAGDTVLAYFGLALAAGHDPRDAAEVANLAAGVKVGKVGTSAVAPSELTVDVEPGASARKYADLTQAVARCEHLRSLGKRIVFTNGCFDLLHAGHVQLLEKARALGDVLVVALNTDASVRRLKGPDRPLMQETDRVKVIAALDAVGLVLLFDDDTPVEVLRQLRPDVLVKGGDYSVETIVGSDLVLGYGGRVETIPLVPGRSTTALLESLRGNGRVD